jgi:uncharacterized repeat protein (TIGR03837 family)
MRTHWDIFCQVVDNYGDIGVCWRLARQLAAEYDLDVRLWIDDVASLSRLVPVANTVAVEQQPQLIDGVWVHFWATPWSTVSAADVVVEAFACELPSAYIAAMLARETPVLWLNLEYLSAEDWVAGCHTLPSLQANGLQKYFFFPGFSADTGGLIRESGLLKDRREFQRSATAREVFLNRIGVQLVADSTLVSLFCYENSHLATLLDHASVAGHPSHVLVPEGRIVGDVCRWLAEDKIEFDEVYARGNVTIQLIPFLSQQDYDRLLWSCDFNVVRGEDSFVRAQWAGRPFLWHIYPQEEGAHLIKMEAFLSHYSCELSAGAKQELLSHWRAWNSADQSVQLDGFIFAPLAELAGHAERWCGVLEGQNNLAESLVQFYQNWV